MNTQYSGERDGASGDQSLDSLELSRAATSAVRRVRQHFPELQPADVDDSVGDACLQLVERIFSGNPPKSPANFLSSVAVRGAHRRSDFAPIGDPPGLPLSVPDFTEQVVDALDLKRELSEPRELSGLEATAWTLKVILGLPVGDVAARMGCCRETIYRRVRGATDKLTLSLRETEYGAPGDEGRRPA